MTTSIHLIATRMLQLFVRSRMAGSDEMFVDCELIPRALADLATRICIVKKIRFAPFCETRDSSAKTARDPRAKISRELSQTRDVRAARVVSWYFSFVQRSCERVG